MSCECECVLHREVLVMASRKTCLRSTARFRSLCLYVDCVYVLFCFDMNMLTNIVYYCLCYDLFLKLC